jgi:hypothetical protein
MPTSIAGRVATQQTLGSRSRQSLQDGAAVVNAGVDYHPTVQLRIEPNFIFQMCLEVSPVSAPEIRAIRLVQ